MRLRGPIRPPLAPARRKPRRRKRETILFPAAIKQEVVEFARGLAEEHAASFADPRMKYRLARLFAAELPPARRRPGRPSIAVVTRAMRMLEDLQRTHPREPARALWQTVYRETIEGFDTLNEVEKRGAAEELRARVRWRRRGRKRSRKMRKIPV
jgi:hypothetical protein